MTPDEIDLFDKLAAKAKGDREGQISIFKVATKWRVIIDTISGQSKAAGKTFGEAAQAALIAPPKPRSKPDAHPKSYFDAAGKYRIAAEALHVLTGTQGLGDRLAIRDPVYFLYAQAVELALKACLLSRGYEITHGHDLSGMYDRCRDKKMIGMTDPHYEMHNVIHLLDGGNALQRHRYPGESATFMPNLAWTKEIVTKLMDAVEPHVAEWVTTHPGKPGPSGNRLVLGPAIYSPLPKPAA